MDEAKYFNRGLGLKQVIGDRVIHDYRSALIERVRAADYRLDVGDVSFRLAREFGFCYGVDRAIEYAYETREKFPERRIFLVGEIIHNPGVNRRLAEMDIDSLDEHGPFDDLRPDDVVIVPAFGVPVETMARLRQADCVIVDTTCGSVLNVWKNVRRYAAAGFTSLIHGKHYHEETKATASQAVAAGQGHYIVVLDMQQAEWVCEFIEGRLAGDSLLERLGAAVSSGFDPDRHLLRLGCANQTTMLSSESLAVAERVRQAMVRRYGEQETTERFRAFDTICTATQDRQDALSELLDGPQLDLLLVVGGYNSSNTGHLLRMAQQRVPAYHILDASCIESLMVIRHQRFREQAEVRSESWLPDGAATVGLTSGASTPDSILEAVIRRVAELKGVQLD